MAVAVPTLDELSQALRSFVEHMDVETYHGDVLLRALEQFAAIERSAAAGKTLMARRIEATNGWKSSGARNAADFVASQTGTSSREVARDIATARRLEELPNAQTAFRSGQLVPTAASQLAKAASEDPALDAAFARMLSAGPSAQELQQRIVEISRTKTAESEREYRHERAHRNRSARFWVDPENDQAYKGFITGSVDDLARINSCVGELTDKQFQRARKEDRHESYDAYRYDAFMDAVDTGGSPRRTKVKNRAIVKIRYENLVDETAEVVEPCEIVGVGTVPAAVAREWAKDSILHLLIEKGASVIGEAVGRPREISTSTMVALIARDPVCKVPGCEVDVGLEVEHRRPASQNGPPSLANLWRVCKKHHYMKTYQGWCLVGPLDAEPVWVKRRTKGDGGRDYPLEGEEDPAECRQRDTG